MPVLKLSAPELAQLALKRSVREDLGDTAIWHYPSENKKAKLLFIHGFRGNHLGLAASAGALLDYEVLIPDLPGYGKSIELASHDLDSYGSWLKELVEQLGEDIVVLGHSFGSLVVANAVNQGLQCRAVVLQNPVSTRSATQMDIPNRLARSFYQVSKQLGRLGSALLRSAVVVRVMSIAMTTSKDLRLRSWIHAQHHAHFSCYRADRVAHEGFDAASKGNVLDHARSFSMPVLLIAGEKDMIAPLENQLLLQRSLSQAELVTIAKVGHLTHYEAAAEVAIAVDEFVAKL